MPSAKSIVRLGSAILSCDLALSPHEQRLGLERYASLSDGDALLFPIRPTRYVTFHTGRVAFPFDVVFVGVDRRVGRIVHDVQPGPDEYWSFGPCAAVIETPGGFCERYKIEIGDEVDFEDTSRVSLWNRFGSLHRGIYEGYSADVSATEPGDHGEAGHDRFRERDPDVTKSNPNAVDGTVPEWDQQLGYDPTTEEHREEDAPSLFRPSARIGRDSRIQSRMTIHPYRRYAQGVEGAELPSGEIVDPVAFATRAIELISNAARQGDSLVWKRDSINPVEEYAFVDANTIKRWLDHVGIGDVPSIVEAATSPSGLNVLSETLVLGEVASRTRMSPDGKTLVLYRPST